MTDSSRADPGDAHDVAGGPVTSRQEKAGYALAGLVLVVGGATTRTPLLNWLVGPAVVVASVWLTTRRRVQGAPR